MLTTSMVLGSLTELMTTAVYISPLDQPESTTATLLLIATTPNQQLLGPSVPPTAARIPFLTKVLLRDSGVELLILLATLATPSAQVLHVLHVRMLLDQQLMQLVLSAVPSLLVLHARLCKRLLPQQQLVLVLAMILALGAIPPALRRASLVLLPMIYRSTDPAATNANAITPVVTVPP